MMSQKLRHFDDDIKHLDQTLTKATVDLYQTIERKYLPTPAKIHYVTRQFSLTSQENAKENIHIAIYFRRSICATYHECSKVFSCVTKLS